MVGVGNIVLDLRGIHMKSSGVTIDYFLLLQRWEI